MFARLVSSPSASFLAREIARGERLGVAPVSIHGDTGDADARRLCCALGAWTGAISIDPGNALVCLPCQFWGSDTLKRGDFK